MKWKKGKLDEALIRCDRGSDCILRTGVPVTVRHDGKEVKVKAMESGVIFFPTEVGQQYQVVPRAPRS